MKEKKRWKGGGRERPKEGRKKKTVGGKKKRKSWTWPNNSFHIIKPVSLP